MKIVINLLKTDIAIVLFIIIGVVLLKESIVPFVDAKEEYQMYLEEKEGLEQEYENLSEASIITEGGEIQSMYAREEYLMSKEDEILFVFPGE